jgi:protein-tyrosine phosphatase
MKLAQKLIKNAGILWSRFTRQGVRVSVLWAADHAVRILTGAPIRRVSQITPQLHVGGQYRRRGWRRLAARGITAVVNLRTEFDDAAAGVLPATIASERYLYLPTVDDTPPTLEQLRQGAEFIAQEVARGGTVYVHCGAGVGRAPTTATAYLVSTGLTPDEAWARIRAVRPFIRIKPEQAAQIERFARSIEQSPPALEGDS